MMKFFLCISPIFLFGASNVDISNSDIVERVVNFIIFSAILWYLLAEKIKQFLLNRKNDIATKLSLIEDNLSASILAKEDVIKSLEKAKEKAEHIVNLAHKEAVILSKNIEEQCMHNIELLNKHYVELREFESNKMKQQVVENVIDELLNDSNIQLAKSDYLNIIKDKVA